MVDLLMMSIFWVETLARIYTLFEHKSAAEVVSFVVSAIGPSARQRQLAARDRPLQQHVIAKAK
jgi:hypothetical protein